MGKQMIAEPPFDDEMKKLFDDVPVNPPLRPGGDVPVSYYEKRQKKQWKRAEKKRKRKLWRATRR